MQIEVDVDDLVDDVARLLDDQQHGAGGVWWDDSDETFRTVFGWESQAAFREAYRGYAREILGLIVPKVAARTAAALSDQLLPQFAEIRQRLLDEVKGTRP